MFEELFDGDVGKATTGFFQLGDPGAVHALFELVSQMFCYSQVFLVVIDVDFMLRFHPTNDVVLFISRDFDVVGSRVLRFRVGVGPRYIVDFQLVFILWYHDGEMSKGWSALD